MSHLIRRVRAAGQRRRVPRQAMPNELASARIWGDLHDDLPDEDLGEDPDDALDSYRLGSKPRCEEAEYLALLEEARERLAEEG